VPLTLDLLRHGHALPADHGGDSARALSARGRRSLELLATRLTAEGWRPDRVFSSPYRRARETAAILLATLSMPPTIEALDELQPESSPLSTLEALRSMKNDGGHVLLVSHQPLLGRLTALLSGAEQGFSPGTLVRFECPLGLRPGQGRLIATCEPDQES
jgi:phosphohistidine phosphatase